MRGPEDLLVLALIVGVAGSVLFLLANLIMKAIGLDINEYADETTRYRTMGFFEQITDFYSALRNIPVGIGMIGLILIFGAVCMVVWAAVWFIAG